jgi:hypothetical protein
MTDFSTAQKLDAREAHFRIPGPRQGLSLFLRYLAAANTEFRPRRAVLYVHGATFPSALSIAHRFDGRSWRDALNDAGFDVWGLDFYGFGPFRPLWGNEPAGREQPAALRRGRRRRAGSGGGPIDPRAREHRKNLVDCAFMGIDAGL